MNPKLLPGLAEEVKVYRDVYLSVHEGVQFVDRIRPVLRHLTNVFTRDAASFNEFGRRHPEMSANTFCRDCQVWLFAMTR